jgi:predicted MPP superfamily phosphohydrolase
MPFYIWHASTFFIFLFLMLGKLIKLPIVSTVWLKRKINKVQTHELTEETTKFPYRSDRRLFLQRGIVVLSGATFTGAMYGTLRRNNYEIVNETISIKNLPNEFDGFTISLISDVHSSVFMSKERMQEYAKIVNSLESDLVLVTGDFVTMQLDEVYPFAEAFSVLKAKHGVYGCLGNHDFYTREVTKVADEVNACGITLLRNNSVKIEKNGQQFYLLGVDDIGTNKQADFAITQAMRNVEESASKILMCHRPYFFETANEKGIDVTFSGHTHGGQVVFFRSSNNVISPARMASPYVSGLYSLGDSKLYVNRGLGTVGIPVRLNCPPEITKITLVAA